jgi:hypothetical protein
MQTGYFSKPSVIQDVAFDATDWRTLGLMSDPQGVGDMAF